MKFDDARRVLRLSVRDLVETSRLQGHLNLEGVSTPMARMALGRLIHDQYQTEQESYRPAFMREKTLKASLTVMGWTIHLMGRADGLADESGVKVVEEVKSTAMDGFRLRATTVEDWVHYVHQVETYLWMLNASGFPSVTGRLILISVVDGARHVLGVDLGFGSADVRIRAQLTRLVQAREARIRWLTRRRSTTLSAPFPQWRPGQAKIEKATLASLQASRPLLVQAPTGLGKTAPVLTSALSYGYSTDRQVFWATARTTQQAVVEATASFFQNTGQAVRSVTLVAKEKACLNEVVSCRPDHCPFANQYYEKVSRAQLLETAWETPVLGREALAAIGQKHEVCPYQLALDLSETADLVVGDTNYAFDPERSILFAQEPEEWVVVSDEAHQLVDRGRGYGSPSLKVSLCLEAVGALEAIDPQSFRPFVRWARDVADAILEAGHTVDGPLRRGLGVVDLSHLAWRELSDRVEDLSMDYLRFRSQLGSGVPGDVDPWLELARQTLRFWRVLESSGPETVCLVDLSPGRARLKLFCLDPSELLQARMRVFAGWVGCSATLSPSEYYLDLLGLDPDGCDQLSLPAFFPPEHRRVLVASKVSTLYKDRLAHADRTAALIMDCIEASPGHVAVYFPSFQMLEDITARLSLPDGQLMAQLRSLTEQQRSDWMKELSVGGEKRVLAAVLGGIFAEGIDLPSGALSAVLIVGPALPPVGLERDLLRGCYEERYGAGFQYASLIPGMTKVIQAAGRMLRSATDKGVIVLIGRRFLWRDYVALLPDWWDLERAQDPVESIRDFWGSEA
jgi:DNA excision repair protein ERCC-2